jgi:hypothetical protein
LIPLQNITGLPAAGRILDFFLIPENRLPQTAVSPGFPWKGPLDDDSRDSGAGSVMGITVL